MKKIKIGLFGLGHLGKIHLKLVKELSIERDDIEIAGIYEVDKESNESISRENNYEINNTPEELIQAILPDVLVKGGDYTLSQIAGAEFVKANGGEVRIVPLVDGFSTTSILAKN